MKTIILCGGQGTRIRDVSSNLPKPMIPIGNRPIIWHIMKYYATYGHKEFVLCLGYLGDLIRDFFMNYESHTCDTRVTLGKQRRIEFINQHDEADWEVTLAETGQDSMTGARIRKVRQYIGDDENFMLTYGDGVGDIDLDALLAFHKKHGKIMTVTGVHPPGRFGEMRCDANGLVSGFNEKPQVSSGCISGGYFVCRRELFDYLDFFNGRDDLVFEQEPMNRLVADQQMMVYKHAGFWQPMDTHREYLLLNKLYENKKAPWMKWDEVE